MLSRVRVDQHGLELLEEDGVQHLSLRGQQRRGMRLAQQLVRLLVREPPSLRCQHSSQVMREDVSAALLVRLVVFLAGALVLHQRSSLKMPKEGE